MHHTDMEIVRQIGQSRGTESEIRLTIVADCISCNHLALHLSDGIPRGHQANQIHRRGGHVQHLALFTASGIPGNYFQVRISTRGAREIRTVVGERRQAFGNAGIRSRITFVDVSVFLGRVWNGVAHPGAWVREDTGPALRRRCGHKTRVVGEYLRGDASSVSVVR